MRYHCNSLSIILKPQNQSEKRVVAQLDKKLNEALKAIYSPPNFKFTSKTLIIVQSMLSGVDISGGGQHFLKICLIEINIGLTQTWE